MKKAKKMKKLKKILSKLCDITRALVNDKVPYGYFDAADLKQARRKLGKKYKHLEKEVF